MNNKRRNMTWIAITAMLLGGCASTPSDTAASHSEEITASVESTLYGSAYTNGKSTLKKEYGINVTYDDDSKAVITLSSGSGSIYDSLIDSSNAKVTLADGDGYNKDYYTLTNTTLDGEWKNGQYTYRLKEGDLEPNNAGYAADNGGHEWSALGSDGKGLYYFNLEVSGIKYNGVEIDPVTIRANVQIYGYDYTADAAELYTEPVTISNDLSEPSDKPEVTDAPVFTWQGEGDKPVLCDANADNFYITWPDDMDASSLKADDITITLNSQYGDELTLTPSTDYEAKQYDHETVIGVNYQYWAFAPVYTTMDITVDSDAVDGLDHDLEQNYDIASVYYNPVQYGGGMDREGTVIWQEVWGFNDETTIDEDGDIFYYILTAYKDGKDMYYTEDESGNASLTEVRPDAKFFMSDADHCKAQKIGNAVVFTEHNGETEDKEVNGEAITFSRLYGALSLGDTSTRELAPGYAWSENQTEHHKWAWQPEISEGWTAINISPMEGRYTWSVAKGGTQQFTADENDVTWYVVGNSSSSTSIDENGVLTVGSDEGTSFSVGCHNADNTRQGAITIYARP